LSVSLTARRQERSLPLKHLSGSAKPGPPRDRPRAPAPPPPPKWRTALIVVGLAITLLLLLRPASSTPPKNYTYTSFINAVTANQIKTATIQANGEVTGTLKSGVSYTSQIPTALNDNTLSTLLLDHKVQVTGAATSGTSALDVILSLLPLLLFVGFFVWIGRRSQKQLAGGIMGFGGSKAKVYDEERPSTRFVDVAGYESTKREISEVVDFLKHPERYRRAGAVGPKGVLMVGPPGTGKTLMARAVAGEADVPFFALTGSSFVELFVGVGASRVRDLFTDARKRAPSIVFIDEIDAIGGRRGAGGFAVNDEREQTLNQLLAEMDGFDPSTGVVVLAATNRIESLDPALLRPGRFDRTVEIPLPNQAERSAILRVHARDKKLGPDIDLDTVARGTPGFSGADLANLVNEAAINAVRENREVITASDFDTARDRILLGHRDATNALLPDEKHSVAVHESGHALVAVLSEHADPVAKVTILPAGMALGVTQQLPEAERHLYPQSYLTDSLAVRLGGRAAEVLVLGEASTGAANDLAGATDLATRMVREWGLSDKIGPIGFSSDGPGRQSSLGLPMRPYAEDTQRLIDEEVTRLLRDAETQATKLLSAHRSELDRVIALLLEKETIDGAELLNVVGIATAHRGPEQTMAPSAAAMSAPASDAQASPA
jgi:cell division protease FtsH